MRLTKSDAVAATEELLARLRAEPAGLRTSELVGSPRFHGGRTLSNAQIIRLLRSSGEAEGRMEGGWKFWAMRWRALPVAAINNK